MAETENLQFKTLHDISRLPQALPSIRSPLPTCPAEIAAKRAALLLGCYRKGEAEDPETFVTAMAMMLSCYPQPVVYRVTDPRSGLPGRSQYLPTVPEVRAACEAQMRAAEPRRARRLPPDVSTHDRATAMARLRDQYAVLANPEGRPSKVEPPPREGDPKFSLDGLKLSDAALKIFGRDMEDQNG